VKVLNRGLALAVVGAGMAASPLIATQATAAEKAEPSLLAQMRDQAQGSVAVSKEAATGKAGFVRADRDLMPERSATDKASAAAKATAYLDKYAPVFGARSSELRQTRVEADNLGWTVVYDQQYRGLPVFGSTLKANIDRQGDLTSVAGFAAPDLDLSTTPAHSADEAATRAVNTVKAKPPTSEEGKPANTSGLRADSTQLVVYRDGAVKGEAGPARLAYQVDVSNVTQTSGTIHDVLFLDATTLKPVNRYSAINDALDRRLYTVTDDGGTPDDVSDDSLAERWREGDPLPKPGLDQDENNMVRSAGEIYNLYKNLAGRDSFDGEGGRMLMVHNRADLCPNASWNGQYTSFCPGVYDDDTVAHEWSHAYTEYTSGLIYQWQSGALNESMSDVFGETVDLLNAREDEGEGDLTVKRTDDACSRFTRGDISATIDAPAEVAGPCAEAVAMQHGPIFDKAGVTADVVVGFDEAEVDEDGEPAGTDTDGCSPLDEPAASPDLWVYIDRGTCVLVDKIQHAEDAGYAGIVMGSDGRPVTSTGGDYDIYGLMVDTASGAKIKSVGEVTMTVKDIDTEVKDDNARWVLSEKSDAFGGAIRDMWKPTCYGDPGKVSDEEYNCSTADHGGVHGNSGVPNHAYALAVDGGTYNGVTINGVGIDKAANIWWRTQSAYLTPTSDFTDLADGLAASCADLMGQPINKVTLGDNQVEAATPITAADCQSIADVAAATELREEAVQCDFQPLLDPAAPSLCGGSFVNEVVWSEDFEDDLAGWEASSEVVYEGGIHEPWVATTSEGHASTYAFGAAPDEGDCVGGEGDFSSRDSIANAPVELGENVLRPKLTFDHSVATELGFDGGNVKLSVNGSPFELIPASAYLYNAPGELATEGEGNTSPLAGEDGFTGTDGGTNTSGWGTSVVDLGALGVVGGDVVQVRFDIGRDGCGGNKGWSVDNVTIVDCKLVTTVAATHKPEPSTFGEASTAAVTVSRNGSTGPAPTGDVVVTDAAGKKLGTATLDNGAASVELPADLPVGKHTLTATYTGGPTTASSSTTFTATVVAAGGTPPSGEKSESTTTAKVSPKHPGFGNDFTVIGKVKAEGLAPRSRIVFKIDGKRIGSRKINEGRAVMTVRKNFGVGKHTLTVIYRGTSTVARSKDKKTFRISR
jgi:Zn-dependent metalloprotease